MLLICTCILTHYTVVHVIYDTVVCHDYNKLPNNKNTKLYVHVLYQLTIYLLVQCVTGQCVIHEQ